MLTITRRFLIAAILIIGTSVSLAQIVQFSGAPSGAFNPSCTESGNFIARTSGLDNTRKTLYDTMICGLVSDGVWSKLDVFYVMAAPDSTTAKLNLVSTSYGLADVGSVTFTADVGYNSSGVPGGLDTSYDPWNGKGSYQFIQDSATIGICDITSHPGSDTGVVMGQSGNGGGTNSSNIWLMPATGFGFVAVNSTGNGFPSIGTQQGSWIYTRSSSSTLELYRNGSKIFDGTQTSASGSSNGLTFYIVGLNAATGDDYPNTSDQFSYAFIGGGFTAGDAANMTSRMNTFLTAIGISVCG